MSIEKKKILLIEQNQDGTIGGSHYCMLYLMQGLNKKYFEPSILFYENNSLLKHFSEEAETNIMAMEPYSGYKNKKIRQMLNMLETIKRIKKCYTFIKKKSIDLVHLNNTVAVGYDTWLPAAVAANVPCITHDRTFLRFNQLNLKFFNTLSKKYSKVLTVSNVIRNNLINQGFNPQKVETVYDGIDSDKFRSRVKKSKKEIMDEFNIDEKTAVIGLVGNIREWKGQAYLIESLNILKDYQNNFFCLFVGDVAKNSDKDRNFMKYLKKKIKQYELEKKVLFTGYRSDVPDIINALDIQVNASIEPDPFPHVILEGMALGKVVIATDLGGARESISHEKSGFLVSPKDPKELAEKISIIIKNKELKKCMSAAAYDRVKNKFTLDKNVENTQRIYHSVINNYSYFLKNKKD